MCVAGRGAAVHMEQQALLPFPYLELLWWEVTILEIGMGRRDGVLVLVLEQHPRHHPGSLGLGQDGTLSHPMSLFKQESGAHMTGA